MARKQSPTARLARSTKDRDFFTPLGRIIFMNTFNTETHTERGFRRYSQGKMVHRRQRHAGL